MRYVPGLGLLELSRPDLAALAAVVLEGASAAELPAAWYEAGLVVNGEMAPLVVGMITVTRRADRWIVVDRLEGPTVTRLRFGWSTDGLATISQDTSSGDVAIHVTGLELLPALVLQAARLDADIVDVAGREPLMTTAAELDPQMDARAPSEVRAGAGPLDITLAAHRHGFRASGGWKGQAPDAAVRVLDCGTHGLWRVRDAGKGAAGTVTLVPITREDALQMLGDVITGRQSALPGGLRRS